MPQSFRFLDEKAELILPMRFDRAKLHLGNFSFRGHRPAQAGSHAGAGERGCGADDSDGQPEIHAAARASASKCSKRPAYRPTVRPLKDDVVGELGQSAVGADGEHRRGAADRLRQRRQPAAGEGRRPAAGTGHAHGAGRQFAAHRRVAAHRERVARRAGRDPGTRVCLRRAARAGGDRARLSSAPGKHLARSAGDRVHARRSRWWRGFSSV